MMTATSAEAWAQVDCSVPCAGAPIVGAGGFGSSGFTGTITVDPTAACAPPGAVGWTCGVGCVPLDNLTGSSGLCEPVCGVQGTLQLTTGTYPANTDLDALGCVRASLRVVNTSIANFSADALTSIGDDFWIQSNASLLSTSAAALVATGTPSASPGTADIVFKSNPALGFALFPALDTVRGALEFSSNAALPNLVGFPSLVTIEQGLKIASNASLDLIAGEFPLLDAVWGTLAVTGNKAMSTFALPVLTTVGPPPPLPAPQGILISANKLTTLNLGNLTNLGSGFTLTAEPLLTVAGIVAMPGLAIIPTSLIIGSNPALANLTPFAAVNFIGADFAVDSNATLASLLPVSNVAFIGGELTIRNNAALPAATFPVIPGVADLEIRSNATLATLGFPALAASGNRIYIWGNASLPDIGGAFTVGFPVLAAIGSRLFIHNNDAMVSVTMPALTTVITEVYAKFNDALTTIALPVINQIGSTPIPPIFDGFVSIAGNPLLTGVGWNPALVVARGAATASASANGAAFCPAFNLWALGNGALAVTCTP
jgi:hypothetical protein